MIKVCANVSREVAEYYKGCDIDDIVNTLLETFEFDRLPQMTGEREAELRVTVDNELYEEMYRKYGSRSKKVSLGRLLEFGMNMDVLNSEGFKIFKVEKPEIDYGLLYTKKAARALKMATKYDDSEILSTALEALKVYIFRHEGTYGSTINMPEQEGEDDVQSTD